MALQSHLRRGFQVSVSLMRENQIRSGAEDASSIPSHAGIVINIVRACVFYNECGMLFV